MIRALIPILTSILLMSACGGKDRVLPVQTDFVGIKTLMLHDKTSVVILKGSEAKIFGELLAEAFKEKGYAVCRHADQCDADAVAILDIIKFRVEQDTHAGFLSRGLAVVYVSSIDFNFSIHDKKTNKILMNYSGSKDQKMRQKDHVVKLVQDISSKIPAAQ